MWHIDLTHCVCNRNVFLKGKHILQLRESSSPREQNENRKTDRRDGPDTEGIEKEHSGRFSCNHNLTRNTLTSNKCVSYMFSALTLQTDFLLLL